MVRQFIDAHGGIQKLDWREAANFFLADIQVPDYDDDRDELLAY